MVAQDAGRVALGVVLVHHPVIVVALHPCEAQLGVLGARQHEGACVVLGRILGDLFRCGHLSFVVDGVFPDFVHTVLVILAVLGGYAEVQVVHVVGVQCHAARVAALRRVPVLVEGMSGILHPCAAPLRTRPAGIPVDVRGLGIVNVWIGDDGTFVLVQGYLPHPVAYVGRVVHDGQGVRCGVGIGLVDVEGAVLYDAQLFAGQVAQDGALSLVDVDDVEVEPVGHLVVGVSGGVGQVDFVLAVRLILAVGALTGRLHYLLRSEVELAVVVRVGHGQSGQGGVPVDASPAEVDVLGVVREDEGGGVGGVVGRSQVFLFAQRRDVARPLRYAVPDFRFVGVARVEDHDAFVGQHQKRRVVVVVGLEVGTHQHVGLPAPEPVVLRGHDVAVYVDVADVRSINLHRGRRGDGGHRVVVVQGSRVGKPAPGTLACHHVASEVVGSMAQGACHQRDKE